LLIQTQYTQPPRKPCHTHQPTALPPGLGKLVASPIKSI